MDGDLKVTFADLGEDAAPVLMLLDEEQEEFTEEALITRAELDVHCFGARYVTGRTCGDCLVGCTDCESEEVCNTCERGYQFPPVE
jgi:hypothetical protein